MHMVLGQEYTRVAMSAGKLKKILTVSPLLCPHGTDTNQYELRR